MNFGEIFEPATRTAWEDWDDDLLSNESNLREHLNLPATAVLYYLEFLESHQMKAIHNLLENFSVSYETNIGSNNIVNSNLYI
ncbi:unnamed protein product [Leptidea sinapis]|uniref:Uncharacterized protein n=1 Tax=Leptidea sinapis TaxID=189913 RepID=A0A5E4QHI1_9NEOP|nr:unnamed protein product [Leptidea sinapis]